MARECDQEEMSRGADNGCTIGKPFDKPVEPQARQSMARDRGARFKPQYSLASLGFHRFGY